MGDHSILLERSRSQQHLRQMDDIDTNSEEDEYIYNNNIENEKLIDVGRKKSRRRRFRLNKRRISISINGFVFLFSIAVLFIITSQVLISIYFKDTYRTGMSKDTRLRRLEFACLNDTG